MPRTARMPRRSTRSRRNPRDRRGLGGDPEQADGSPLRGPAARAGASRPDRGRRSPRRQLQEPAALGLRGRPGTSDPRAPRARSARTPATSPARRPLSASSRPTRPCPVPRCRSMWDLGLAAENMMLAAWELGIGSCPATVYDQAVARERPRPPERPLLRLRPVVRVSGGSRGHDPAASGRRPAGARRGRSTGSAGRRLLRGSAAPAARSAPTPARYAANRPIEPDVAARPARRGATCARARRCTPGSGRARPIAGRSRRERRLEHVVAASGGRPRLRQVGARRTSQPGRVLAEVVQEQAGLPLERAEPGEASQLVGVEGAVRGRDPEPDRGARARRRRPRSRRPRSRGR